MADEGIPHVSRRGVHSPRGHSELLEAGNGPGGPEGSFAGSPNVFSSEGGPHANIGYRSRDPSTIGGGRWPGESSLDAPRYGDWIRHSTGAGGGALGHEGFGFPGQGTWGESENLREARDVAGRGPHAGRGPRSYRRPDARIEEEIHDRLTRHPGLDASDIEVRVARGEVTLSGRVRDRRSRRLAEDVVADVPGVRDVMNHLRAPGRGDIGAW
jgi:hypothetical protein